MQNTENDNKGNEPKLQQGDTEDPPNPSSAEQLERAQRESYQPPQTDTLVPPKEMTKHPNQYEGTLNDNQ